MSSSARPQSARVRTQTGRTNVAAQKRPTSARASFARSRSSNQGFTDRASSEDVRVARTAPRPASAGPARRPSCGATPRIPAPRNAASRQPLAAGSGAPRPTPRTPSVAAEKVVAWEEYVPFITARSNNDTEYGFDHHDFNAFLMPERPPIRDPLRHDVTFAAGGMPPPVHGQTIDPATCTVNYADGRRAEMLDLHSIHDFRLNFDMLRKREFARQFIDRNRSRLNKFTEFGAQSPKQVYLMLCATENFSGVIKSLMQQEQAQNLGGGSHGVSRCLTYGPKHTPPLPVTVASDLMLASTATSRMDRDQRRHALFEPSIRDRETRYCRMKGNIPDYHGFSQYAHHRVRAGDKPRR